jgi:hypothetical protein
VSELPPQHVSSAPATPWWRLRAAWLYDALLEGALRDHDGKDEPSYPVTSEALGVLSLPGGEVVAADPYVMDDTRPFTQRLAADEATVVAARALMGEGHERVAALVLRVGSGATVVDWTHATQPGEELASLESDHFFGYGVDAGTGSFGGVAAMAVAERVTRADAGMLEDPISAALFADGIGTRSAVLVAPEPGAAPIAVCSSGWGDGVYPTWLGLDAEGRVVVAVTDFLLTRDPHAAPEEDVPAGRAPGPATPLRPRRSLLDRLLRR